MVAVGENGRLVWITSDTASKIKLNTDYEAKRTGDLSLQMPTIVVARKGLFEKWLKSSGKLGGQHKIPRLNNNRDFIEEVLKLN